MAREIEIQQPLWEPGTQGCYHTFTMGYLCSELVRRVTGRTLGQFVREEISLPFDVDFHFGLSDAEQRRCAEIRGTRMSVHGYHTRPHHVAR